MKGGGTLGQILSTGWQPDHSDALVRLIADGFSYAEAAGAINAEFQTGYSRNACIGRANRLGLQCPSKPKQARAPRKPQKSRQRYSPESKRILTIFESADVIKLRCVELVPRGLALLELEPADCRYPYGDEAITFCGHPKQDGSSYCHAHHALTRAAPRVLSDDDRQRRRLHFIKLGGMPSREVA